MKKMNLAIGATVLALLIGSPLAGLANMGAEGPRQQRSERDRGQESHRGAGLEARDRAAFEGSSGTIRTTPTCRTGSVSRSANRAISTAAFSAYNAALKLNPQHKAAHEYIGEAYLLTGDIGKAEQHLTELQKLCTPMPCEEYKDLRRALDDYKKKKK